MTSDGILWTARLVHDGLIDIFPTSSPASVYEVLVVLYCHGMRPHPMRKVSLFIFAVTTAVTVISAEIFYNSVRFVSCHLSYVGR